MKRAPLVRRPMRRRYRYTGPNANTRALVLQRDDYRCIICGGLTTQLHHRKPRSRGGGNSPANLILLCGSGTAGCHGFVESRREESYDHGYLLLTRDDPSEVPVHYIGVGYLGIYKLADDGTRIPVPHLEDPW